jgi:hypothetical protein
MVNIFDTNPITSFFRDNGEIFSVLALFTVLFGILSDIHSNSSNHSSDILLYPILFIYFLLVILYGIVIYLGFNAGFKNSSSVIEVLQRRVLVLVSLIMMMIVIFMGWFLFSEFPTPFIVIGYAVISYAILYVFSYFADYLPDKVKSKNEAIVGLICSLCLTIFSFYLVLIVLNYGTSAIRLGRNYQNSPDIWGPIFGEIAILSALLSIAIILILVFFKKVRTMET